MRIDRTVTRIRAEVRDPWGVRSAIREHPYLTAGTAVACGAVAVGVISRRRPRERPARDRPGYWIDKLVDAAVETVKPLVEVWAKQWLVGPPSAPESPSDEPTA